MSCEIRALVKAGGIRMTYLSIAQPAERLGLSPRRIQLPCLEGRAAGAVRIGHYLAIPDDETKPADARIKNGKYIKKKSESVGQPQQR